MVRSYTSNATPPPPAFPLPTPPHNPSNTKLKRTSEQAFPNSSPTRPDDGLRVVRPIPKRPRLVQTAGSSSMAIKLEEEDRGVGARVKLEPRDQDRVPLLPARAAAPPPPARNLLGDDLAYAVERLRGVLAQTRNRPRQFRGPQPIVKKEEDMEDDANLLDEDEEDEDVDVDDEAHSEEEQGRHGVKQETEDEGDAFYSFPAYHSSPIRPSASNNAVRAYPREASQSPFRGSQRMITRSQTRQMLDTTTTPARPAMRPLADLEELFSRRAATPGPSAPGPSGSASGRRRQNGAQIKQESVAHPGWRNASSSGRAGDVFSPAAASHGGRGSIDFSMSDGAGPAPAEDEDENMDARSYAEMSGVEENGEDSDARRERERREKGKERERIGEREKLRKRRTYVFKGVTIR